MVSPTRTEMDRTAAWGVPAHVTVLYPFLSPERIGSAEIERLAAAIASVPHFEVTFTEVQWFGEDVAWLDPKPADGFRALTDAVFAEFPDCPPYAGEFDGSVPHLTIAEHHEPELMRAAADQIKARLPISASVASVYLFEGTAVLGGWRRVAAFPLGG